MQESESFIFQQSPLLPPYCVSDCSFAPPRSCVFCGFTLFLEHHLLRQICSCLDPPCYIHVRISQTRSSRSKVSLFFAWPRRGNTHHDLYSILLPDNNITRRLLFGISATNQQTIPTSYHLFPSCSRESTDNCSYTHQCLHFRHPQTHSETSSAENRNAKKLLAGQKKTRCLISRIFNIVVPVPSAIVITTSNIW